MFSPLPIKHISLQILTEDLPNASMLLAELACFSPDHRPYAEEALPEVPGHAFRTLHTQAKSRLEKIAAQVDFDLASRSQSSGPISEEELERVNQWLGSAWETVSDFEEAARFRDRIRHLREKAILK